MFDKMLRKYKIGETLENPLQTVIKEKRGVDSFLFFFKNLNKTKLIIVTVKCICELSLFTIVTKINL